MVGERCVSIFLSAVQMAMFAGWISPVNTMGFHGIAGDYCGAGGTPRCCANRDDQCTAPILDDHFCYCDMFCDRGETGNDCCPDFDAVCRGYHRPQLNKKLDCTHNGIGYSDGDVSYRNCNKCTCVNNDWVCDSETCLIQESLLERVSQGRYPWSARNYSEFWGRTLEDGIRYRLGTLLPEQSVQNMNEIQIKPRELPVSFDAREKWPAYIHGIRDQGDCASSWAMSTTATSADRLAIITEGRLNRALSAQQLISCNQHRQRGCEGGYLDRAWWYIRKLGVVSEDCYPYESGFSQQPGECRIPKPSYRVGSLLLCPNPTAETAIHKMTPPYRVSSREEDIMTEIITNGPVQATFLVHEDFFMYSGGVYEKLDTGDADAERNTRRGYHSVRLIGWGVDESTGRPMKYWLAMNSWGVQWGEEGLFRIRRGDNHCEIEAFIVAAWGKGSNSRRRRFKLRKLRRRIRKL